jgi:lysozyme
MGKASLAGVLAAIVAGAATLASAEAARTRGIQVEANKQIGDVQLTLQIAPLAGSSAEPTAGPQRFHIGDRVVVCFTASADGYATIWSYDADGKIDRIYPAPLTALDAARRSAPVKANAKNCIGQEASFRLRVTPPPGGSRVFAYWTQNEQDQIDQESYPEIGRGIGVTSSTAYASATVDYEIIDDQADQPATPQDYPTIDDAMVPGIFLDKDEDRALLTAKAIIRQVFDEGITVTQTAEGWRSFLYNDAAGYCTIGYGHLVKLARCDGSEPRKFRAGLSRPDGVALLYEDIRPAEATVSISVTKTLNDPQYAALVDFVYNVGSRNFRNSTLLRVVNAIPDQDVQVAAQFAAWIKAGGKIIDGLKKRREKEIALYFTGRTLPTETKGLVPTVPPIDIRTGEQ